MGGAESFLWGAVELGGSGHCRERETTSPRDQLQRAGSTQRATVCSCREQGRERDGSLQRAGLLDGGRAEERERGQ